MNFIVYSQTKNWRQTRLFKIKCIGSESFKGLRGTERLADALDKQNEKCKDVWIAGNIEVSDNKEMISLRLVNKKTRKSKIISNKEQLTWLVTQLENGNIKVTYRK